MQAKLAQRTFKRASPEVVGTNSAKCESVRGTDSDRKMFVPAQISRGHLWVSVTFLRSQASVNLRKYFALSLYMQLKGLN